MKVVYNACYGGFSLSDEAIELYLKKKGWAPRTEKDKWGYTHYYLDQSNKEVHFYDRDVDRDDPDLVAVVEELGSEKASGACANLLIEDVPSGSLYRIEEYDGFESVMFINDYDWKVAR